MIRRIAVLNLVKACFAPAPVLGSSRGLLNSLVCGKASSAVVRVEHVLNSRSRSARRRPRECTGCEVATKPDPGSPKVLLRNSASRRTRDARRLPPFRFNQDNGGGPSARL